MRQVYIITVLLFSLSACSQEAQPYEEVNTTLFSEQTKGHIQTH